MDIQTAIKKAITVFSQNKGNWELAEKDLRNSDIPLPLVEKLLEFMPLAFGRVFMKDLGVKLKDEYVRYVYLDGKIIQKFRGKLNEEPVFTKSLQLASNLISQKSGVECLWFVATTSAEVKAVNELMNKGSKPENLVLTEPYLQWREELKNETPFGLKQNRSWWEFWK